MSYMQGNLISNDQLEDVETGARPSSLADYKRLTRLIPTNTQKVVFKGKVFLISIIKPLSPHQHQHLRK